MVANLIFLRNISIPDIQPIILFLTTRVKNPDKDDWKKLRRVLSYLDATIHSVNLHLNVNDLNFFH